MKILETTLPGVLLIECPVYRDARGHFQEVWNGPRYASHGLHMEFAQDNLSFSRRGVLRGLHFQHPAGQGKLVSAVQGSVYDVAVDIRRGSPNFGCWFGAELSAENGRHMYIPPGFAHGFLVLSETAHFLYKCTEVYRPDAEGCVRWDDPGLRISWPLEGEPLVSPKDAAAVTLAELAGERLPEYDGEGLAGR